jgi:hypothetical protein
LANADPVGPETIVWQQGDVQWYRNPGDEAKPGESSARVDQVRAEPLVVHLAAGDPSGRRALERVAPSRLHDRTSRTLADRFGSVESRPAKARGTLVHACFERIEWLDDGPPDRAGLRSALASLVKGNLDVEEVIDQFYRMLDLGHTGRLLCRGAYQSPLALPLAPEVLETLGERGLTATVRREYPFAQRRSGQLIQGSIDRLVLLYDGPTAVAADIIDFKTDADLSAAEARHRDQLLAYRDAVSQMCRLETDHIAARLLMVNDGTVVAIT